MLIEGRFWEKYNFKAFFLFGKIFFFYKLWKNKIGHKENIVTKKITLKNYFCEKKIWMLYYW